MIKKHLFALAALTLPAAGAFVPTASAQGLLNIVINEVYPGGGSSSATAAYRTDFIELYNPGATTLDISGFRLDYGASTSAAGTFASAIGVLPANSMIPALGYFLIRTGGSGTGGAADVTADVVFPSTGLSAASGAIRLELSTATPTILDVVGYGTTNNFEGAAAATPTSVAVSLQRTNGVDTNNNSVDFASRTPTPTASGFAPVPEPSTYAMMAGGLGLLLLGQRVRRRTVRA